MKTKKRDRDVGKNEISRQGRGNGAKREEGVSLGTAQSCPTSAGALND